jgi:hypothetical protein
MRGISENISSDNILLLVVVSIGYVAHVEEDKRI